LREAERYAALKIIIYSFHSPFFMCISGFVARDPTINQLRRLSIGSMSSPKRNGYAQFSC
jgi:hypothetical protein